MNSKSKKQQMIIGINRRTKELIGYSKPNNGMSILVTAYAVDDLQKKFDKAVKKIEKFVIHKMNYYKSIQHMIDNEENETKLMVATSKGKIV